MNYELTFITDKKADEKEIIKTLEANEAKILDTVDLGVKKLAYLIKKQSVGHYFHIQFEAEKNNIKKLSDDLSRQKEVLRFLITKALRQTKPLKPLAPAAPKESALEADIQPETEVEKETALGSPAEPEKISAPKTTAAKEIAKETAKESKKETKSEKKAPKPAVKSAQKPKKEVEKIAKAPSAELDKKLEELTKE